MKSFDKFSLKLAKCKTELASFKNLLDSKAGLSERVTSCRSLRRIDTSPPWSALTIPKSTDLTASPPNLTYSVIIPVTWRWVIRPATISVWWSSRMPHRIAYSRKRRVKPPPSGRHGLITDSAILDWFNILEDQTGTAQFKTKFESDSIQYVGLLVIGRRQYLDNTQYDRLRWRSEHVQVGARHVNCITFDELYQTLALKVAIFG